jgi:hypothetical protein
VANYTLDIPDALYQRARQIAEETAQSIDRVLLERLHTLFLTEADTEPVPALAPDEESELAALRSLSDDALWTIARERLPEDVSARMETLMDRNSAGTITSVEYEELETLVERGQRLMVRKSEAAALLKSRGYKVSPQQLATRE